jgi:hypothetical protein
MLVAKEYCQERDPFLQNCFLNLLYNTSVPQLLTLAISIFDSIPSHRTMGTQPAELREFVILRHSAKQNLVNSIVDITTLFSVS